MAGPDGGSRPRRRPWIPRTVTAAISAEVWPYCVAVKRRSAAQSFANLPREISTPYQWTTSPPPGGKAGQGSIGPTPRFHTHGGGAGPVMTARTSPGWSVYLCSDQAPYHRQLYTIDGGYADRSMTV